jgi:glucan biosynthesis protein
MQRKKNPVEFPIKKQLFLTALKKYLNKNFPNKCKPQIHDSSDAVLLSNEGRWWLLPLSLPVMWVIFKQV